MTPAQITALGTHIRQNTDPIPAGLGGFEGVQVKDVPNTSDGRHVVAAYYSLLVSPDVYGWNKAASIEAILNALNYTNYTPNENPAQATEVNGQTWENRAMLVQIKQINLQLLLQGRTTFDATRANLRAGLQDATENLPTGNNGAARTGGWAAIQLTLSRAMRRVEVVLRNAGAGGSGTQAAPYTVDHEGTCQPNDVEAALLAVPPTP
jgi:hypothetical protein